MSKVGDVGDGVPVTHTGGSGQSSHPGEGNPLKPPTLRSSNVDDLYQCFLHRQVTWSTRSCVFSSEVVS
jgi:hypothetical protein